MNFVGNIFFILFVKFIKLVCLIRTKDCLIWYSLNLDLNMMLIKFIIISYDKIQESSFLSCKMPTFLCQCLCLWKMEINPARKPKKAVPISRQYSIVVCFGKLRKDHNYHKYRTCQTVFSPSIQSNLICGFCLQLTYRMSNTIQWEKDLNVFFLFFVFHSSIH